MFGWGTKDSVTSAVTFDKVVEVEPRRKTGGGPSTSDHRRPGKPRRPPSAYIGAEATANLDGLTGETSGQDAPPQVKPPALPKAPTLPPAPADHAEHAGAKGIALSGGGIRSATFSLGALQSLAKHHQLSTFDYLSTISGGGYIGSWLSAWISREGLPAVEAALGNCGSAGGSQPVTAEAPPVTWLRKYSNYLAPRVGLLSIDSLTSVSIAVRNVVLNMTIVIAFIATLLLIPKILLGYVSSDAPD